MLFNHPMQVHFAQLIKSTRIQRFSLHLYFSSCLLRFGKRNFCLQPLDHRAQMLFEHDLELVYIAIEVISTVGKAIYIAKLCKEALNLLELCDFLLQVRLTGAKG